MRPFLLLAVLLAALTAAEPVVREIRDPLRHAWPWELVSFDMDEAEAAGLASVTVDGQVRPVQVEAAGPGRSRVWCIASAPGGKTGDGVLRLEFGAAPAAPLLTMAASPAGLALGNGLSTLHLAASQTFAPPRPLAQVPHWFAGLDLAGSRRGTAVFLGEALVERVETTVLRQGPVLADVAITYHFVTPVGARRPMTAALPLALGKQCHLWTDGRAPTETVMALPASYEVRVRVVGGDPWIEVVERCHLGNGHGYRLELGATGAFDTVLWPRWFEYDRFGGNVDLLTFPCAPRPEQQGRPFANLQPRWTQMGACSQDVWFTRGGKAGPANRDEPCVGLVAAFASKWVAPYAHIIAAEVADDGRAWADFPLRDGEPGGLHHGGRAWALCAGPRRLFDDTGRANAMVRRHSDWTLTALNERYRLTWERDAALAGPHLLATRAQIAAVAAAPADSPLGLRLAACRARRAVVQAELAPLLVRDGELAKAEKAGDAAAKRERAALKARLRPLQDGLASPGWKVLDLIDGKELPKGDPPDAGLFLARRYQDDFLNPTSPGVRRLREGLLAADLAGGGKPQGGAAQAASAYVFTDLDAWPGWQQGWHPGNPNFHTDKYQPAILYAGMLADHPHARDWLAQGRDAFLEDMGRVLAPPDGVGYECPGYSGYSLRHQLGLARVLINAGVTDLLDRLPLLTATGRWHRHLLTPPDVRLGNRRHEAPIGDTHRWFAGLGEGFADLAALLSGRHAAAATEFLAAARLAEPGLREDDGEAVLRLLHLDPGHAVADPAALDWASRTWHGFGAILRRGFGTPRETFCTIKAGRMRGHYHNDELAFHFHADATPISLDYNCSYHPRGDHAALHNAVTFGAVGTVRHNGRGVDVAAREQLFGSGTVLAFAGTPQADVVVAERAGDGVTLSPVDPGDSEFARGYPSRRTGRLVHRRFLCLVAHAPDSPLSDYLVIRDETAGGEPAQVNVHLLARSAAVEGQTVRAVGQLSHDILVQAVSGGGAPTLGRWFYHDDKVRPPPAVLRAEGEDDAAWAARTAGLGDDLGPALDAKPWEERLRASEGRDLILPPGWMRPWPWGEYQVSARFDLPAGGSCLWVLIPHRRGAPVPQVAPVGSHGVRVTAGGVSEEIHLGSDAPDGQAVLVRDGTATVLLKTDAVPHNLDGGAGGPGFTLPNRPDGSGAEPNR